MSSAPYSLLVLEKTAWQLLGQEGQSPRETFSLDELIDQAPAILNALVEAGQAGQPLVIGLAADWCLNATIDIASLQMLRKPTLVHYQLEEWIPWSAEEFVSDFIGHKHQAFCVATRHEQLAPLLDALDAEDVLIAAVVPMPLLALEEHLQAEDLGDHRLIWCEDNAVDLLSMRQGQLQCWSHLPNDSRDVNNHLRLEQLTQGTCQPLYIRGQTLEIAEASPLAELSQLAAATSISQAIIAGQHEPAIDLRQGQLRGKQSFEVLGLQISRLKLASALLAICLAIACWVRAGQHREVIDDVQVQLAGVHQKVFPGAEVPERIGVAFSQEHRQLQGTREPSSELPIPTAADIVLENVLQHLPPKLRFRLPEIRIEQDRVTLGGEVRSNADADLIATALRARGFSVDPPRTQRLADKGFGVRLHAKVGGDKP